MASQTFTSDGSFTVPSNVSEVTIECRGGRSDADFNFYEGQGGVVKGTRDVSPGQTLYVRINDDGGAGGPDGAGGSDGAGSVDVRAGGTGLNDRIAVAAGGGGAGADDSNSTSGGGNGGADVGQDGTGDDIVTGKGGTQTSGGAGPFSASNGSFGAGGNGGTYGGGGGGGWYGGGGGSDDASVGAGGGGGSNYDDGLTTVETNQRGGSNAQEVIISYTVLPEAPLNTSQTVTGDDAIDLSWDENTSAGNPSDYDIQVSEDGGSYTQVANVSGSTTYSYSASPSTNSHRFRVRASNSAGTSDWAYTETVATDPTNLSVTGTAQSEISLAWDSVRDATGYEVLLAEASGDAASDYSSEATPAAAPYTITDLEDGERYYARVRATYSGTDSQLTNEVDATTPLPAPALDAPNASTPREITIPYTLEDNSTDGDVLVERSADGGATWSEIATVTDLSATAYTDAGLLDGREYTYRLTRRTDHAETTSATVSAITILPAPTNLAPTTIGDTSVGYAWDATHNQGQTRVEFRRAGEGDDWTTYETVSNGTEAATIDGLLTGEQYEGRVVAQTDFTETEDE